MLEGGVGQDQLLGGDDNDQLIGGDGDDVLFGEDGNDALFGGADDDVLLGEDGDDALFGDEGEDQLLGGAGADALFGGGGDDVLRGGNHNDVLNGEAGADQLFGDGGNDLYLYRVGDGREEILDERGDNGLWLLDASALSHLEAFDLGSDLVLRLGESQQVKIRNWRGEGGIGYLRAGEHGYLARESFLQPASAGELWTFTGDPAARGTAGDDLIRIAARGAVSAGAGNDRYVIDTSGEVEVLDAQGANTLQFAPGIRLADLAVSARDSRYVLTTRDATVVITPGQIAHFVFDDGLVLSANEFDTRYAQLVDPAPRVLQPASVQAAFVATPFHYALPSGQFIDLFPGDTLRETVTGRAGGALPHWLRYDAEARAFTGTPTVAGTVEIEIQVQDRRGQSAVDHFAIDVLPTLGEQVVAIFEPDLLPANQGTWVTRFGSQTASPYLLGVGDLNHDGLDDLLEPEAARIVFGRREGFGTDYAHPALNGYNGFSLANFDLASLTPNGGGLERYNPLRGDFNHDGVADVVLGTRALLGRATPFSAAVDFTALPLAEVFTMPVVNAFAPHLRMADGAAVEAARIHAIGDYNGDQREDYFAWLNEARGVVIYGVTDLNTVIDVDNFFSSSSGFAINFLPYPGLPGDAAPNALSYAN